MRILRWLSICVFATATVPTPGGVPAPPVPVAAAAAAVDSAPVARPVRLAFTGDVNLGGRVGDTIDANGVHYPWSDVSPVLTTADLAVVNLECAVSERGVAADKEFTFRGRPEALEGMAAAGIDIASVANNHAMDFGPDALVDTLGHLRAAGIEPAGGGASVEEAWRPVVREVNGLRIAFVAATRVLPLGFAATAARAGVASAYDEVRLLETVRAARAGADVVVVLVHWGVELAREPNGVQTGLARALAAAGAGVVVGHHPHVLQPVEYVDGALIAYSLGNFVFSPGSQAGAESMILDVLIHPDGRIDYDSVPARIVNRRPVLSHSSHPLSASRSPQPAA